MQTIHRVTGRFTFFDEAGKQYLVVEVTEFSREKETDEWRAKDRTQSYWQDGQPVRRRPDGSFVLEKDGTILDTKRNKQLVH